MLIRNILMMNGIAMVLIDTPLDAHPTSPFIVAAITAVAFALIARFTSDSPLLGALGGAILGLATAGMLVGFATSMTTPNIPTELGKAQTGALAVSIVIIAVIGAWLLWSRRSGRPG
jgi:lipopolysaccharide export LptBFGC system permease protein LptF